MSLTALILTQSLARRGELAAKYGYRASERAIYLTAARLIAGDYKT